jgi:hypothetical protein
MIKIVQLGVFFCFFANFAYSAEYEFSYFSSIRGAYVFGANEAAPPSNGGLLTGKDFGTAGKAHGFRPLGLEAIASWSLSGNKYFDASLRWTQANFRLSASDDLQRSQDAMLSTAFRFKQESFGGAVGLRFRQFIMSPGPLPDSGQAGLYIQFIYEPSAWNILAEASLMALGQSLDKAWGLQRDSSSLRIKVAKNLWVNDAFKLKPFVEFFHLHRSFFATDLGSDALFVDDASLVMGLAVMWN